jgi:hypothetical protein
MMFRLIRRPNYITLFICDLALLGLEMVRLRFDSSSKLTEPDLHSFCQDLLSS